MAPESVRPSRHRRERRIRSRVPTSVTSSGVPNTVTVEMKDRISSPRRSRRGIAMSACRVVMVRMGAVPDRRRVRLRARQVPHRRRIRSVDAGAHEMGPPFAKVHDARGKAFRGCSASRSTLTGGSSSRRFGMPSRKGAIDAVRRHHVPVAVDGERRIGLVTLEHHADGLERGPQSGILDRRSGKTGAKPAAARMWLRWRKRYRQRLGSRMTMSRDGAARPLSTKLRCRWEMSASSARPKWLSRRRWRHSRSSAPAVGEGVFVSCRRS
jgi:hypothetical protein